MLDRFKFSDILNVISIGSLFLLIILFAIYRIYPATALNCWRHINVKESSTIVLFAGALLSIPLSRIISAFVESLIYPLEVKDGSKPYVKFVDKSKSLYRSIFFLLPSKRGLSSKKVIYDQILAKTELGSITRANIEGKLKLKVDMMKEDEFQDVYLQIKSFTNLKSDGDLYSYQYNTIYNYHARLAIVFNISSILTFSTYLYQLSMRLSIFFTIDFFLAILFYILGVYFAGTLKSYGERQVVLLIYDFNAKCYSFDERKN